MIVGVPKEIKRDEYRVGLLPVGAEELTRAGHRVLVEAMAGIGSGLADHEYLRQGAEIVSGPEEIYAQGYRVCDNYDERKMQIELLAQNLRQVDELARIPWTRAGLRLVKAPARRAGWSELYEFLARGYAALRHMRKVERFVEIIEKRETLILERIFSSHPQPFDI